MTNDILRKVNIRILLTVLGFFGVECDVKDH